MKMCRYPACAVKRITTVFDYLTFRDRIMVKRIDMHVVIKTLSDFNGVLTVHCKCRIHERK